MTSRDNQERGHLAPAPESFLGADLVDEIHTSGVNAARRRLLKGALATATAAAIPQVAATDDADILTLPSWSRSLGKPVVTTPYGQPSPFEAQVIKRQSPGLTQTNQASVAFTPLQSLFGMITPSGLHFERHHQGWVDIDPTRHRLMINGLVDSPSVFTMADLLHGAKGL